jgi:protein transport protein SEC13
MWCLAAHLQVWRFIEKLNEWQQDGSPLLGHSDWVRDVAWAPNLGLPGNILASAGQDGKVLIWSESQETPGTWSPMLLHDFKVNVRLSQTRFSML